MEKWRTDEVEGTLVSPLSSFCILPISPPLSVSPPHLLHLVRCAARFTFNPLSLRLNPLGVSSSFIHLSVRL